MTRVRRGTDGMTGPRRPSNFEHPTALGSFRSWIRLLSSLGGVDRTYLPRAVFVSLTTLLTGPLKLWEQARYGRRIRNTEIHPAPIFIIGHWRSGTTHLHNLLCRDRNLGYLSTFQAMTPGFSLTGGGAIKRLLARMAGSRYPTRLIDNIPLDLDAPQEDEFALANVTPCSFVHTFSFPRRGREIFERSVLFDGLPEEDRRRWVEAYSLLLRKATFASDGRRLVVKNCAHTGRLRILLELFPDAKFIHIHRDPYHVFLSTLHMHRTVLQRAQLQEAEEDRIEANVLRFYERLMQRYLDDRHRIPPGNLVEIRFDALETDPLSQLRHIYDSLDLPGYDSVEPEIRSYVDAVAGYRKNVYDLNEDVIEKVNEHWGFAFEPWDYERLDPSVLNRGGRTP